ncbi:MAG: cyclic pyranopterin monophosphate synthase MoaC [Candidatus Thermoplasmatota archaeon]|nr:cyclic pyranopterin monophosphate synthase MoaC [Candidatus Thermoplasmatota archaeon]MCG2827360.1 cyclic pyranopterin monophosphate synthase MoaC [Thermoplasmatales archaeon]
MIDISDKKIVMRKAKAKGEIKLKNETIKAIKKNMIKKGDALTVAKIAGLNAVKNTSMLIPMCHPVPVSAVNIDFILRENSVICSCEVKAEYKTGVEMEALTGVSVALLTIWDMVKYLEKDEDGQYPETRITNVEVVEKVKGE